MTELTHALAKRMKSHRIGLDAPDGDTLLLRNVPTNARFFSKPRTNLLLKRPREALPFLLCVDEDLEYMGDDAGLAKLFAGSVRQRGWRVLVLGQHGFADPDACVESALAVLGFEGREPTLRHALPTGPEQSSAARPRDDKPRPLLASFGVDLSQHVADGTAEPAVGCGEETEDLLSCVLQRQPRLAVVVGPSGVGKTSLLRSAAQRMHQLRPSYRLLSVDMSQLFAGAAFEAERDNRLEGLLSEIASAPDTVVALEQLHLALSETLHAPLLLSHALDAGVRLVGTMLPNSLPVRDLGPLSRRLHIIELAEATPDQTLAVLLATRDRIANYHGLSIDRALLPAVLQTAAPLEGQLPAKAVSLLDAAAARARLAGAAEVGVYHVYLAASRLADVRES